MTRTYDIHKLHQAEVRLIQEQSALLLQKREHGFNGELKSSGIIVEMYIKSLLAKHIPDGYRMCSGYIATTETIGNPENLLQHDVIIADARVPSIHQFGFGDIEVVPAEAVCGIIEVKRTLTKPVLDQAIQHLRATKSVLDKYDGGIRSKTSAANNAVGPTLSMATCSPLYAIVGLDCCEKTVTRDYVDSDLTPSIVEFIDVIWGIAASFFLRFALTKIGENIPYFPTTVSRSGWDGCAIRSFDQFGYADRPLFHDRDDLEKSKIFGTAISCFRQWIKQTSGTALDYEKNTLYFGAK